MAPIIRSVRNPRIRLAIRLRSRRGRQQQARIIVDGLRETRHAIDAGIMPIELFLCETMLDDAQDDVLRGLLAMTSIEPTLVTEDVYAKLAFGNRREGIILIADEPQCQLKDIRLPDNAFVGVLESVEKPGNLGAILRTADAAGVTAIVVADGGTDLFNHNAIRASLGAIFRIPVAATNATDVLHWLRSNQLRIFAARVDAAIDYADVNFHGRTAIILGSESKGLSDVWYAEDIIAIGLPMQGTVDSLNVSATAAVLFYEQVRQRRL